LPPMGTALARQAISWPTSSSEESSNPDLLARSCAAATDSGMSTNTTVSIVGRTVHALLVPHSTGVRGLLCGILRSPTPALPYWYRALGTKGTDAVSAACDD